MSILFLSWERCYGGVAGGAAFFASKAQQEERARHAQLADREGLSVGQQALCESI
jgi:hypothetical protein